MNVQELEGRASVFLPTIALQILIQVLSPGFSPEALHGSHN
jgi:hypothetical protein